MMMLGGCPGAEESRDPIAVPRENFKGCKSKVTAKWTSGADCPTPEELLLCPNQVYFKEAGRDGFRLDRFDPDAEACYYSAPAEGDSAC